jgi:hypothetical protein
MAVEIKPFIVGSKKATSALIGGITGGVFGFAVFIVCIKWLGLPFGDALKVAGAMAALTGGSGTALYPLLEGIRDIAGKARERGEERERERER